MSLHFANQSVRQNAPDQQATIQKLLDENSQLIAKIKECQVHGRVEEALPHQKLLHRNLTMLARGADQSLLAVLRDDSNGQPSPGSDAVGTSAAPVGPGGDNRSATPQQASAQLQASPHPPLAQVPTPQPLQQQLSPGVSQMHPPASVNSLAPPNMAPQGGAMVPPQHPQQMQYMGHPQGPMHPHHQQYMQYQQGMPPYGMSPGQGYIDHQQQQLMYQQQQQQMAAMQAQTGPPPPQGYPQTHHRQ